MKPEGKEAPVGANLNLVSRQQKITQAAKDRLLLQTRLCSQGLAGVLQGLRLTAHPFAIGQAVFSLQSKLQLHPSR